LAQIRLPELVQSSGRAPEKADLARMVDRKNCYWLLATGFWQRS